MHSKFGNQYVGRPMLPASLWLPGDTHIYADFQFKSSISVYKGEEMQLANTVGALVCLAPPAAGLSSFGGP
jgi:hypothetical protein